MSTAASFDVGGFLEYRKLVKELFLEAMFVDTIEIEDYQILAYRTSDKGDLVVMVLLIAWEPSPPVSNVWQGRQV
jgi:hypothetical protein